MSELKARGVDDVYIEYYNTGKHELAQVYLKSEADQVIAELKEERRWRKCSEELPKLEEDVGEIFLVAVEVESNARPRGSYVTSAEFCEGEWYNDTTGSEIEENIERDEEGLLYRSKVTHWRPLPKAPELAEKFKE